MYKLGDMLINRIVETEGPAAKPHELFSNYEDNKIQLHKDWLYPNFYDEVTGSLIISVHSFLLQTKHHTILIDTCIGNHKIRKFYPPGNQLNTPYLDKLKTIVNPENIDFVICTHLHLDHVGWNVHLQNNQLIPTFPNAQYIFSRTDFDFWKNMRKINDERDISDGCLEDSILPIVESQQAKLIEGVFEIEDGVWIEPSPGHSPGHMCVCVSSKNEKAVFSGDIMHHPLQVKEPEWNTHFCNDPNQSAKTRRLFLTKYANSDVKIFPAHFPTPTWGRIVRDKEEFHFLFGI